jgi:hypothetical protein
MWLMESITDPSEFAKQIFGRANLGDARRTQRLVNAAAALAKHPSASIPAACENDGARVEGFYKLIRNEDVDPEAIRRAVFDSTSAAAKRRQGDLLLIHDTTSVSPVHSLREELRTKRGSPAGYEVHTGLVVEAATRSPIGILGQLIWNRNVKKSEKLLVAESAKWQRLDEQIQARDIDQQRLIRVADRESDFFEYIQFLDKNASRFVLRAAQNRRVTVGGEYSYLWEVAQNAPVLGMRTVAIEQRGGQKKGLEQSAREARPCRHVATMLRATQVELRAPGGKTTIRINLVYVASADGELEWLLLTRESIETLQDIERVVSHYEARWLIERFHKSWKTGCKIEERQMGSLDNFLRIMAITMPIAVRLLHLQVLANQLDDSAPATAVLSQPEIEVLWAKVERTPLPKKMPSCRWAYISIAKIAGWQDSKRTGRIGLDTIWRGIERLLGLAEGWQMAKALST